MTLVAGVALAAIGLGVTVAALAITWDGPFDGAWAEAIAPVARLAVVVGVIMWGASIVALRGRTMEEAYRLGYDIGFEKGVVVGRRSQHCDLTDESIAAALDEYEN